MGRTLVIEKELQDYIDNSLGSQKTPQVGLVIGQLSESRDYAIHLARSPDPVDDEVQVEASSSCSDEDVTELTKNKKNVKTERTLVSGSELDAKWIVEHARQVNRMLTGGMNVLGVYMLSTPEVFNKTQAKLRQCLLAIHKRIENITSLRNSLVHNDKYLLHVCTLSRKITCRTVDTNDDQSVLRPADFHSQPFLHTWRCVNSCIAINVDCYVPLCQDVSRTEQKIVYACQKEIESIWKSYATIDYKMITESEPLDKNKGKRKGSVEESIEVCLFKAPNMQAGKVDVKNDSATAQVKFVGNIVAKAFLHSKATYGDAVKALKVDIIRSLLTRIQLLCEEAEVNNLCHVDEWSLMSPTRVFGSFKDYSLYFCDYIFKDECEDDILGRFKELLNLKLKNDKLLFLERSPDPSLVSMILLGDTNVDHHSDVASEISTSIHEDGKDKRIVAVSLALIVALLGCAIHLISK